MLAPPLSPIPAINIEFCVEQNVVKEPSSPFDNVTFTVVENGVDAYRSIHLLPPPVHSPKERATPASPRSKGLDAARFEALRNQSKNNLKLGLRKEVAMRVHQTKQSECYALLCPSPLLSASLVLPRLY